MAASALDFVPIGANAETLPANLTEGRFRHFWEQDRQVSWGCSCGRSVDEAFDACVLFRRNCNPKCIRDCFRDAAKCGDKPTRAALWTRTLPWHSGQRVRHPLSRRNACSSAIACHMRRVPLPATFNCVPTWSTSASGQVVSPPRGKPSNSSRAVSLSRDALLNACPPDFGQ